MAQSVKNLPGAQETWVQSLSGEDPWRRNWQPTPVFLPGKSHGQRNLVGSSPWGPKSQTQLSDQTRGELNDSKASSSVMDMRKSYSIVQSLLGGNKDK